MADILNQDEINALVNAYQATGGQGASVGASEKQVRLYDFTRPDKFSKEHLRALKMIHSRHGTYVAAGLARMFRNPVRADLLGLDQLTYREYCASIPDGTLIVEVSLEPLASGLIFEFNPHLVFNFVDMLAGGMFASQSQKPEITDVDKAIMKSVIDLSLKKYAEAWSPFVHVRPKITSLSTGISNQQMMLPTEAVLVAAFEVGIGEMVSMMSICMPAASLQGILPKLAGKTRGVSGQLDAINPALLHSFSEVEMECKAILGETTLSLQEVTELEVGDLVMLPIKSNALVELSVENIPAFAGVIGVSGQNLAVRVSGSLAELNSI